MTGKLPKAQMAAEYPDPAPLHPDDAAPTPAADANVVEPSPPAPPASELPSTPAPRE